MKHRVCLVTNYLSAGGLERVLTRLATYFVEKKEVQVTIVTLFNTQCFYSLSDKVEVIYPNFDILAIYFPSLFLLLPATNKPFPALLLKKQLFILIFSHA